MIAVHRDYCLSSSSELHAHVKVNPVGRLEDWKLKLSNLKSVIRPSLMIYLLKVVDVKLEFVAKKTQPRGSSILQLPTR